MSGVFRKSRVGKARYLYVVIRTSRTLGVQGRKGVGKTGNIRGTCNVQRLCNVDAARRWK